jgi:Transcriptional regulator
METTKDLDRGDATRQVLIEAAITIFARDGYHAARTRDIAQQAGVNQALINYHFKSKQGLYLAVFEYIIGRIQARILPTKNKIQKLLTQHDWQTMNLLERKTLLVPFLLEIADGFLDLLTSEETASWAQLIIREQQQPTSAFDFIYTAFFDSIISAIVGLIQPLRDTGKEEATMIAFTVLGQMLIWRVGRAGILRKLDWQTIGRDELKKIESIVFRNIEAIVFAREVHDER